MAEITASPQGPHHAELRAPGLHTRIGTRHFGAGPAQDHRIEGIGTPLPAVAHHVVQPEAVGCESVDRRQPIKAIGALIAIGETALPDIAAMLAARCLVVAPRKPCTLQPAARSPLPLRLGRQTLARPGGKRGGIGPAHMDHRQCVTRIERRMRPLGMTPVGARHLTPPGGGCHATGRLEIVGQEPGKHHRRPGAFGIGDIAGGGNEACKAGIAHRTAIDLEGAQHHRPRRPFAIARIALASIAAHAKFAGRNRHHVVAVMQQRILARRTARSTAHPTARPTKLSRLSDDRRGRRWRCPSCGHCRPSVVFACSASPWRSLRSIFSGNSNTSRSKPPSKTKGGA